MDGGGIISAMVVVDVSVEEEWCDSVILVTTSSVEDDEAAGIVALG